MVLDCPRCNSQHLTAASHGALACSQCGGMFVPHERAYEFATELPAAAADSRQGDAIRCPRDRGFMTRARVEAPGGTPIYLDRCSSCLGVWFDAGEWTALASAHLLEHLDEFWSTEWRTRQRRESEAARHDERLREEFGPELYERLTTLASDLRTNPRRSQALAFLREESARKA